jgi:hypothetical protein
MDICSFYISLLMLYNRKHNLWPIGELQGRSENCIGGLALEIFSLGSLKWDFRVFDL